MSEVIEVRNVRLEAPPAVLAQRFARRISVVGLDIAHCATPFVARLGDQPVQGLVLKIGGVGFHGFVRRPPRPGDRLYVGYHRATNATSFVVEGAPPSRLPVS